MNPHNVQTRLVWCGVLQCFIASIVSTQVATDCVGETNGARFVVHAWAVQADREISSQLGVVRGPTITEDVSLGKVLLCMASSSGAVTIVDHGDIRVSIGSEGIYNGDRTIDYSKKELKALRERGWSLPSMTSNGFNRVGMLLHIKAKEKSAKGLTLYVKLDCGFPEQVDASDTSTLLSQRVSQEYDMPLPFSKFYVLGLGTTLRHRDNMIVLMVEEEGKEPHSGRPINDFRWKDVGHGQ